MSQSARPWSLSKGRCVTQTTPPQCSHYIISFRQSREAFAAITPQNVSTQETSQSYGARMDAHLDQQLTNFRAVVTNAAKRRCSCTFFYIVHKETIELHKKHQHVETTRLSLEYRLKMFRPLIHVLQREGSLYANEDLLQLMHIVLGTGAHTTPGLSPPVSIDSIVSRYLTFLITCAKPDEAANTDAYYRRECVLPPEHACPCKKHRPTKLGKGSKRKDGTIIGRTLELHVGHLTGLFEEVLHRPHRTMTPFTPLTSSSLCHDAGKVLPQPLQRQPRHSHHHVPQKGRHATGHPPLSCTRHLLH